MMERPGSVSRRAGVAGVGGGHGVAVLHATGQTRVADGAGKSAVAVAEIFAVPSSGWQPNFNLDVGILRWFDLCGHAAEGRQILKSRRCGWSEWFCYGRVLAGGDGLGRGDGGVLELEAPELVAGFGVGK